MPRVRCYSFKQAVETILESGDSENEYVTDVCILPPDDDGVESEIEAVDEEELSPNEPFDVCGEIDVFIEHDNSETEESIPAVLKPRKRKVPRVDKEKIKKCKATAERLTWEKHDMFAEGLPEDVPAPLANTHPELSAKSPLDLFDEIFDNDSFEYFRLQFELYAHRDKNTPSFSTSVDEIRKYFGILLLSGYHHLPSERDYWSTADDLGCAIVPKVMSRNRFQDMKKFSHFADNSCLADSKAAKVKPLYDLLNTSLLKYGVFSHSLSIGESIVPYYGHHGAKMFISGKSIRFGYKIWMMCGSDGYPYQASLYCGKGDRLEDRNVGGHIVLSFAEMLPEKSRHRLFFDDFFTSYSLLCQLKDLGICATGTLREGRLGTGHLPDKCSFKKTERGKYDYICDGKVCFVRWGDNDVITCGSNYDTVLPVVKVVRHVKGTKDKQKVLQPLMISNYMSGIGGVDLMDRLLSAYRPLIKSKKWWWNLFTNAINMAIVAAWKIHCQVHDSSQTMTHFEFRRNVVIGLLKGSSCQHLSRPSAPLPASVRFDGVEHYIESTKQGRCVECSKNTKKRCVKCLKRLHERCFQSYHFKSMHEKIDDVTIL